jgi:hypothetical protein
MPTDPAPVPPVVVELVGPRNQTRYEVNLWNEAEADYFPVARLTQQQALAAFYALADALGIQNYSQRDPRAPWPQMETPVRPYPPTVTSGRMIRDRRHGQ